MSEDCKMTDATGKIVNLTKVVDGKTNRITVTDTDGDYASSLTTTNSIMGFDKNDKVNVKGDISVFTQEEINNAFFKSYDKEDSRAADGCELADLVKPNLAVKEGKLSGNPSYAFALGELSDVFSAAEKALEAPAQGPKQAATPAATTAPAAPAVTTPPPVSNPVQPTSVQPAGLPASYAMPVIDPSFSFASANLIRTVSNYFGSTLNTSMPSGNLNGLAEYVWNSIPINTPTNPFVAPQNNTAPAADDAAQNAPQDTVDNGTGAPAGAPASTAPAALVTEGEIKDDSKAVVTEGEIKEESDKEKATTVAEKPKSKVADNGKNKAGQTLKKYTDKDGNRVIEFSENGKFVRKDIYNEGQRIGTEMADGRVYVLRKDGKYDVLLPDVNEFGQFIKEYKDKNGNRIVEAYENNKMVEKTTYTDVKIGDLKYGETSKTETFEGNRFRLPLKVEAEIKKERTISQDALSVKKPIILEPAQ